MAPALKKQILDAIVQAEEPATQASNSNSEQGKNGSGCGSMIVGDCTGDSRTSNANEQGFDTPETQVTVEDLRGPVCNASIRSA
eukprot:GSA25T00027069001.1